jgi:hypothetical protein
MLAYLLCVLVTYLAMRYISRDTLEPTYLGVEAMFWLPFACVVLGGFLRCFLVRADEAEL